MICGNGHGYMPIVIEGVPPEKFAAWVGAKHKNTSQNDVNTTRLASAASAASQ
jgi:heme/copper-type cytochrome/quinol oxidase subunit 2